MWRWLLVYSLLLLISGCVVKPSAFEMAKADYGQVPDTYAKLITYKIQKGLPNPQAAKIEVSRPYPAIRALGIWNGGGYEYGHVVHAWITPKHDAERSVRNSSQIFWWSHTGWSTMLPSLEGITPKYPEQAEEYAGVTFSR